MKLSWTFVSCVFLFACSAETQPSGPNGPIVLPPQEKIEAPAAQGEERAPDPSSPSTATSTVEQYKLPAWMRPDVQPKSARFNETYGLEALRGTTMVVILLEGYCPYCQSNSVVAQDLQNELSAEGLDAQIVILGDGNAAEFASRVSLPIFKDADKSAWNEMRAGAYKHDTFVFAPNGERTFFLAGSYQGDPANWRIEIGAAVRKVATKK